MNDVKIMDEVWKDIDGFYGLYQISNYGNVKSLARYTAQNHWIDEKILNINHSQGGYCDVSLYKNGKRYHRKLHRLVAEAFIPNPNNLPEVDHIDTNKDNNRVDNLRWCTHSENHLNPITVELKRKLNIGKKMSEEQRKKQCRPISVFKDGEFVYTFESCAEMDKLSKEILGIKLWSVYATKVINGEMPTYHGFTFKDAYGD